MHALCVHASHRGRDRRSGRLERAVPGHRWNPAPPPARSRPAISVAGRYKEILGSLGAGGMGAVYKARDRELDRLVAVKVLRPDRTRPVPALLERFKQELILARAVSHRNVVRIFDLGQANGIKFITMEYVEGRTLRTLLRDRKRLAPREAVEITRQILHGLRLHTASPSSPSRSQARERDDIPAAGSTSWTSASHARSPARA